MLKPLTRITAWALTKISPVASRTTVVLHSMCGNIVCMGDNTRKPVRTLTDVNTGDIFEIRPPDLEDKPKHRTPFGKRWHKMAFEAHIQLATMADMFTNDFRVLHLILPTIHDGNMVYINQAQMAKELRMTPSVVSRSIRKLIEKGFVERVMSPSGRLYKLSANFAWYGSDNERHWMEIRARKRKSVVQ